MTAVLGGRQSSDSEGYTVEQAEGLMPTGVRFELHGGRIIVTSPARLWHTDAQHRLMELLRRQGHVAYAEVGLAIAPKETRVIDVATFREQPDTEGSYFRPGEIALAVEVVSPSSEQDDYIDKPSLYARLGIREFWRVDRPDDTKVSVSMFSLNQEDRVYVPTRTVTLEDLEAEAESEAESEAATE